MRLRWLAIPALAVALAGWSVIAHPWGWLYGLGVHPYPESSDTPWTYQLLSGFVPALTVLTLLGALVSMYHVRNCHKDGCWRIGRHRVSGTPWCNRHVGEARPSVSTEELLTQILAELRVLRSTP
jgi:hypothetical protein